MDKIKMDNFSMVWKSYQVLREDLKVSEEEMDELIKYQESKEKFEICEQLKRKLQRINE
tara:strand:- start:42079 stop:42255 length:177 start_codon:yes stop_codon:yes gene_type:complete